MARTVIEIIDIIKSLLMESDLAQAVNGKIYRIGDRPDFSICEDIIITHKSGNGDRVQEGVANILIYTLDNLTTEGYRKNILRLNILEPLSREWIESVNTYAMTCRLTLKSPIEIVEESEIGQHYICLNVNYKLIN